MLTTTNVFELVAVKATIVLVEFFSCFSVVFVGSPMYDLMLSLYTMKALLFGDCGCALKTYIPTYVVFRDGEIVAIKRSWGTRTIKAILFSYAVKMYKSSVKD